ncbi:MAG: MgtC/SapB family protein [Candidatus Diapherotrites archaeon]|nr:MgtC/SapB family protein [Candidatus Diapherotrites archaeon]
MIGETIFIERLIISAVLGGLIGVEREMHEKPAGFRTHIFVCLGATLFTLVSLSIGGDSSTVDISRIAAGVVTGIGFLAAGTIFRERDRTVGLTTAADLWVVAAIGLTVGIGYYSLAAVTTIFVVAVLIVGRVLDVYFLNRLSKKEKLLAKKE